MQIVFTEHTVLNLLNMASVQYGVIVTGLKGNIGGSTFQNGNVSKVLRNKGYRAGTSFGVRRAQISKLMTATSSWRSLSQSHRAAWNASAGNWPFKDKFGNTYYSSGYQKYVAQSTALIGLGLPLTTTPDLPYSANDPGLISVDFSDPSDLLVTWVNTPVIDQFLQVFASAPLSAGRNGRNTRLKLIGLYNMVSATSVSIQTGYNDALGDALSGAAISVKFQIRTQQFPIIQFPSALVAIVG